MESVARDSSRRNSVTCEWVKTFKKQWYLIAAGVAIAIAAGVFVALRPGGPSTPEQLVACLPAKDGAAAYIDVRALRLSGILDSVIGTKTVEEPEYKEFVGGTGFDYRKDLDRIAVEFAGDTNYFVLRGNFNWKRIMAYAVGHGGKCTNEFCQIAASQPGKSISFFKLGSGAMALAVGPDAWAAGAITLAKSAPSSNVPQQPVWVAVPAQVLRDPSRLPAGTHAFATALSNADRVVFAIGPQDTRFQVALDVTCSNADTASALLVQLEGATSMLRKMMARENVKPNPNDLSGILTSGSFRRENQRVYGSWPLEKSFLTSLAGSASN